MCRPMHYTAKYALIWTLHIGPLIVMLWHKKRLPSYRYFVTESSGHQQFILSKRVASNLKDHDVLMITLKLVITSATLLMHYDDVIMSEIASQITSLTIVYSTVRSGADQSKHQSSASLAFVWEIHRWPVNFPHKWPVTRKIFPFDDVIMVSTGNLAELLEMKPRDVGPTTGSPFTSVKTSIRGSSQYKDVILPA